MIRSDFTYEIKNNVLMIEDLNLGRMSVTNNMEDVIEHIFKENTQLDQNTTNIIYKDSDGVWDGVKHDFIKHRSQFYSIQYRDKDLAFMWVSENGPITRIDYT